MKIDIEESKVNQLLKELFFDEVIGRKRICYEANNQDFDFTPKINGVSFGREYELSVEIFTPNYDAQTMEALREQIMGLPVLRLVTVSSEAFMDDVRAYLKEESSDSSHLRDSLIKRADEILGSAKAFVDGAQLDVLTKSSGRDFVTECFQCFIETTYPKLNMPGNIAYSEDTFKHILRGFPVAGLFEDGDDSVSEAESQIVDFVKSRKKQREQTSINDLKIHFSKQPFGWCTNATFTLLSKLYKKNEIEVTVDNNPVNEDELVSSLLDSSKHGSTFVNIQVDYFLDKMMDIKLFYTIISGTYAMSKDDAEVARDFPKQLGIFADEVNSLLAKEKEFPFVAALRSYHDELFYLSQKNINDLLDNFSNLFDLLMDVKEDEYDPVKEFINGDKGKLYRDIVQTIEANSANLDFMEGDELRRLTLFIKHPHPYRGNLLQDAEQHRQRFIEKLTKLIEEERILTIQMYEEELITLLTHPEILKLKESDSARLLAPMEKKMAKLKTQRFIGNLRAARAELPDMMEEILNQAVRRNAPASTDEGSAKSAIGYISKNNIPVSFDKSELTNEDDVHTYITELEHTFLNQIRKNKRIRL